jgi:hypothetical protein
LIKCFNNLVFILNPYPQPFPLLGKGVKVSPKGGNLEGVKTKVLKQHLNPYPQPFPLLGKGVKVSPEGGDLEGVKTKVFSKV